MQLVGKVLLKIKKELILLIHAVAGQFWNQFVESGANKQLHLPPPSMEGFEKKRDQLYQMAAIGDDQGEMKPRPSKLCMASTLPRAINIIYIYIYIYRYLYISHILLCEQKQVFVNVYQTASCGGNAMKGVCFCFPPISQGCILNLFMLV